MTQFDNDTTDPEFTIPPPSRVTPSVVVAGCMLVALVCCALAACVYGCTNLPPATMTVPDAAFDANHPPGY